MPEPVGWRFEPFTALNSTQYFPLDDQTPALTIAKQNSFFAEFFSEHFIFGLQIINNILLFAVDPTSEDKEEQLPRLQNEVHMSPDAGLVKKNSIRHRQSAVNRKE